MWGQRLSSLRRRSFGRPWLWAVILGVPLLLIAVVTLFVLLWPETNYLAGYLDGATAAKNDLAHGRAVNLFYGLPRWHEMLDRDTGLPNQTTGCIVYPRIEGYVAGYRKTVSDYIAEHGLPANSRKPWEAILFNLHKYYEDRVHGANPQLLEIDRTLSSPDGQIVVALMIQPATPDIPSVYLVGTIQRGLQEPVKWSAYPMGPDNPHLQLFWGPSGGDFIVLHGRMPGRNGGANDLYGALDLRTGNWLRYEVSPCQEPDAQP